MTSVQRYKNGSTSANLRMILDALGDADCKSVVLHATPEHNVAVVISFWNGREVICDGIFLTVASIHRYPEVKALLDIAEVNNKVMFHHKQSRDTSRLTPEEAFDELNNGSFTPLTAESRSHFFSLLHGLSEKEFESAGR